MSMWDIDQPNPISGRRSRRPERRSRKARKEVTEKDLANTSTTLVKTAGDFMLAGAGIAVIGGLGGALISGLAKK